MTKFLEWSETLSIGIEERDTQHQVLVDLVNEMHDAIHQRLRSDVVRDALSKLGEYARLHFAIEESLMRILGYPGYEKHQEEHKKLIEHLQDLQRKLETKKMAISFELMHFPKVWLTKHFLESDQEYADFFLQAGAKPRLKKKSWGSRIWEHLHP